MLDFGYPFQHIESRLRITLADDLALALQDGVVLCHIANHVRPRAVQSIHVPSPAVVSDSEQCSSLVWIALVN